MRVAIYALVSTAKRERFRHKAQLTLGICEAHFAPENRFRPYHLGVNQSLTVRAQIAVRTRILVASNGLTTRTTRVGQRMVTPSHPKADVHIFPQTTPRRGQNRKNACVRTRLAVEPSECDLIRLLTSSVAPRYGC